MKNLSRNLLKRGCICAHGSVPCNVHKQERDDSRIERDDSRSERDDGRSERYGNRSERDDSRSERDDNRSERDSNRSEQDDNKSERDGNRSERDDDGSEREGNSRVQGMARDPQIFFACAIFISLTSIIIHSLSRSSRSLSSPSLMRR